MQEEEIRLKSEKFVTSVFSVTDCVSVVALRCKQIFQAQRKSMPPFVDTQWPVAIHGSTPSKSINRSSRSKQVEEGSSFGETLTVKNRARLEQHDDELSESGSSSSGKRNSIQTNKLSHLPPAYSPLLSQDSFHKQQVEENLQFYETTAQRYANRIKMRN